jgi:hypothetical protein
MVAVEVQAQGAGPRVAPSRVERKWQVGREMLLYRLTEPRSTPVQYEHRGKWRRIAMDHGRWNPFCRSMPPTGKGVSR